MLQVQRKHEAEDKAEVVKNLGGNIRPTEMHME